MRKQAVKFKGSQGRELVGVLRLPEGAKVGLVTVGGWGAGRYGPNNMLADLCVYAASQGAAALDFDLSGRGDAEGDPANITVDDMMDDCNAAVCLLKEQGVERIVLFGLCSGGNAALGATAFGAQVATVIAVSTLPYVPIENSSAARKKATGHLRGYFLKLFRAETWRKFFRGGISFKGVMNTLLGKKGAAAKSDRALKDTKRDVMPALAKFTGHIIHIYGGADPESAPSRAYFEGFYKAKGVSAEFHILENANHNFYGLEWRKQIMELTKSALQNN